MNAQFNAKVLADYYDFSFPVISVERLQKMSTQRLYNILKMVRKSRACFFAYDGLSLEELDSESQVIGSSLIGYEDTLKGILDTREHLPRKKRKTQYVKPGKGACAK